MATTKKKTPTFKRNPGPAGAADPAALDAFVQGGAASVRATPAPAPAAAEKAKKVRVTVDLAPETHKALKMRAVQEGDNLQGIIARLVDEYLAG